MELITLKVAIQVEVDSHGNDKIPLDLFHLVQSAVCGHDTTAHVVLEEVKTKQFLTHQVYNQGGNK